MMSLLTITLCSWMLPETVAVHIRSDTIDDHSTWGSSDGKYERALKSSPGSRGPPGGKQQEDGDPAKGDPHGDFSQDDPDGGFSKGDPRGGRGSRGGRGTRGGRGSRGPGGRGSRGPR